MRRDFANRSIDEPVEMFGYRKALRSEIEALIAYNRLLRAMTDLALRGTAPANLASVAASVGDSPIVDFPALRHHR